MREIRLSGSEGGGTQVLPTPIYKALFEIGSKQADPDISFAVINSPDIDRRILCL